MSQVRHVRQVGDELIVVTVPVAFTLKDVQSEDWFDIRRSLVLNAAATIELSIDEKVKEMTGK